MGKKKTINEYKQEVKSIGNGEYEVLSDEYFGNKTKLTMLHRTCGFRYDVKPNVFLSGSRCPFCAGKVRKDTEYFKNEVKQLVGDEYEVLGEYKNTHTKIVFKHKCGHVFNMTPHNFLSGQRCPICQHRSWAKTTDEFKHEMFEAVGNEYALLDEYKNNRTKVQVIHNTCGHKYMVTPSDFIAGYRCPYCFGNMKKTQEKFESDVKRVHGSEYSVLEEYINSQTKVKIRHNKCGHEWMSKPNDIIHKASGCPACNQSKGESRIAVVLDSFGVPYEIQKRYSNLKGRGISKLSYDFYLPNYNIFIEYQGQQHYYPVEWFGGEEKYIRQCENDNKKREFAKEHNIDLLEISYLDFDNIESILKSRLLNQSA